jgi:L-glyceraldehyde 3-phosphate reductase
VTSVLSGASTPEQLTHNVAALGKLDFPAETLAEIDRYATESGINRWARSSQAG